MPFTIRRHHTSRPRSHSIRTPLTVQLPRNPTRQVTIGTLTIGNGAPIAVQSMTATSTQDVQATLAQVRDLDQAGADVVRIAVDSTADAKAVVEIAAQTDANLAVDLQENYRLAEIVAPHVAKLRYNPGHLYHHEPDRPWQDKVQGIVLQATRHDCAIRVGVNCGSVDPEQLDRYDHDDSISPMLDSAWEHCELLDSLGFTRYCVSLKDSDPRKVVQLNRQFAEQRPEVPLHLGVTEAGMPPDGTIKTRIAFEQLLGRGIGDTVRVSLTVPNAEKPAEIAAGHQIIEDIAAGRVRSVVDFNPDSLNIISCPSCSRCSSSRTRGCSTSRCPSASRSRPCRPTRHDRWWRW